MRGKASNGKVHHVRASSLKKPGCGDIPLLGQIWQVFLSRKLLPSPLCQPLCTPRRRVTDTSLPENEEDVPPECRYDEEKQSGWHVSICLWRRPGGTSKNGDGHGNLEGISASSLSEPIYSSSLVGLFAGGLVFCDCLYERSSVCVGRHG